LISFLGEPRWAHAKQDARRRRKTPQGGKGVPNVPQRKGRALVLFSLLQRNHLRVSKREKKNRTSLRKADIQEMRRKKDSQKKPLI